MFFELASLLLITGQQTVSQGHEQCVVAEQRAFSLEAVGLSRREGGGREQGAREPRRKRERERDCTLWALIAAA